MMFYEVSQTEIHFQPGEFMTFYLLIENFLWLFGSLGFHYSLVLEDVGKIENFVDFMDTQTQVVPGELFKADFLNESRSCSQPRR